MRKRLESVNAAIVVMCLSGVASAGSVDSYTFSFIPVERFGTVQAQVGMDQFKLNVFEAPSNQIAFRFINEGPVGSVFTELYWEDVNSNLLDELLATSPKVDTTNSKVDYTAMDEPSGNSGLPGSNSFFGFKVNDFGIQPENPAPEWGVGPEEEVTVFFSTDGGVTLNDVIDAINGSSLIVGTHVQSFELFTPGTSDSLGFVAEPVPSPTAALMGSAMLGGLVLRRRRRQA